MKTKQKENVTVGVKAKNNSYRSSREQRRRYYENRIPVYHGSGKEAVIAERIAGDAEHIGEKQIMSYKNATKNKKYKVVRFADKKELTFLTR